MEGGNLHRQVVVLALGWCYLHRWAEKLLLEGRSVSEVLLVDRHEILFLDKGAMVSVGGLGEGGVSAD